MDNDWLFVEEGSHLRAIDEELDVVPDGQANLDPTQPGPNRVTMWVPTETTLINVGAAFSHDTLTGQDLGIAARTDSHIHFHTMGIAGVVEEEPTSPFDLADPVPRRGVVRLGIPAATVVARGRSMTSGNQPSSLMPEMHNTWSGYSMLTEGSALHESFGNHVIASTDGEVRVAANAAVQIGTPGNIYLYANEHSSTDFFMRNAIEEESLIDMMGDGNVEAERKVERTIKDVASATTATLSTIMALEELARQRYARSPLELLSGWKAIDPFDAIGTGLKIGAAGLSLYLFADDVGADPSPSGRVSIYGSTSVKSYANVSSSIHSGVASTLTADVATIVDANVATIVSSAIFVGVTSGLLASVSGTLSAKLSSQLGSAGVAGRTKVEVTSGEGNVFITGQKDVQLNSIDGGVHLHGKTCFYMGVGAGPWKEPGPFTARGYDGGPGYAVMGDADGISICKVDHANFFSVNAKKPNDAPTPHEGPREDTLKGMFVQESSVVLLWGDANSHTSVEVSQDGLYCSVGLPFINETFFQFTADGAKINGRRILLGE
jgi:hypothetical protein